MIFTAYYIIVGLIVLSWFLMTRFGRYSRLWKKMTFKQKTEAVFISTFLFLAPIGIAKEHLVSEFSRTEYVANPIGDWYEEIVSEPVMDRWDEFVMDNCDDMGCFYIWVDRTFVQTQGQQPIELEIDEDAS